MDKFISMTRKIYKLMKRIIRLFSKRSYRTFSMQNKDMSGIVDQLDSYKKDKSTIFNHFYHSIEKLYKYDMLIEEKTRYLETLPVSIGGITKTLNADIIKEYFALRKELGFNEGLLAGLLRTLAGQTFRNHNPRALQADMAGPFLIHSPLFRLIIDDVKLLTYDKMEIDLEQLASIVNSLTKLDYKDPVLIEKLLHKLNYIVKNPKHTNNDLGDDKKEQLLQPSLQNYNNILDKSVFKNFLNEIIQVKKEPINASQALKNLKALETNETDDLDQVLTRLESVLDNYKALNIEFLNTIVAIRSYYFELKQEEKFEIMKKQPDIFLDFLRLENNLIRCGFLMPKDLLEGANQEDQESVSLLLEQLILEVGADPQFVEGLLRTNQLNLVDKPLTVQNTLASEDQENNITDIASKNQNAHEDIAISESYFYARVFEAVESILDNMRARTSCMDPKDNYRFEGFKHAFNDSDDSLKAMMKDTMGKIIVDPYASFDIVDSEKVKIGHFYFTKSFDICSEMIDNLFESLNTKIRDNTQISEAEFLDLEGSLRLYLLGQKSLKANVSKFAEEKIHQILSAGDSISPEAIKFAIHHVEFLNKPILINLISRVGVHNLVKEEFVSDVLNPSLPLSDQINAAFFFYILLQFGDAKELSSAVSSAIFKFASERNLENVYDFQYKKEIPVSYEYHKLFYILQYINENKSEYTKLGLTSSILAFEKARIKVNSYLNIDFEHLLRGDPVFSMLFNKLVEVNPEVAKNLQDLHLLLDIPLPILPAVISKTPSQTHCLVLNFPNEDEQAISSEIRQHFLKSRITNGDIHVLNINKFFRDAEFYKTMNFEFSSNLDSILNQIWQKDVNATSIETQALNEVHEILKINPNDASELKNKKLHFIKIFSTLEDTVANSQEFESIKMSVIRKSLIFYLQALQQVLGTEIAESQKSDLQKLADQIQSRIPADHLSDIVFPYGFHGKRFSLELPSKGNNEPADYRDFLNYKAFSNQSYFLLQSWKNDLEEYLDPIQYNESVDYFYTKNGRFNKTLLPNVGGRQLSRPSFQFFWEELAYSTNLDQKQKIITYETIASLNNYARLDNKNKWKVSLLNFAYEFKTKAEVDQTLQKLFECDFWKSLHNNLSQHRQQANAEPTSNFVDEFPTHDELFNVKDFEYYLNKSIKPHQSSTPYEEFMKSKLEIKTSLEYWKELFDVTLPKLYSLADSDLAKQNIHAAYVNAKEKYLEAMQNYQNNLAVIDSAFNIEYFKDLIIRINGQTIESGSEKSKANSASKSLLLDNKKIEKLSQNNCLKHLIIYKERFGRELSENEKSFKESWKQLIHKNGLIDSFVHNQVSDITIGEAFSENDLKFFENHFIHASIQNFKQQKLSDFLTILNLLLNPDLIAVEESKHFVGSHLPSIQNSPIQFNVQQIASFIASPLTNASRFDLDYSLNNIWFKSSRITDNERSIIKEMLSVYKSNFTRRIEGRRKVACQRYAGLRRGDCQCERSFNQPHG